MSEKRITEENRYAGLALAEEELVARVAWCYYHDGELRNNKRNNFAPIKAGE